MAEWDATGLVPKTAMPEQPAEPDPSSSRVSLLSLLLHHQVSQAAVYAPLSTAAAAVASPEPSRRPAPSPSLTGARSLAFKLGVLVLQVACVFGAECGGRSAR
ncbi:hypothetical protein BWI15_37425 [Kribbella sp. ALI-6-A]|uniref:hypothetical protein n=1 Tax=Kribbella sp. ALI-6-A TaxID=1933817 RepID=UPI00097CB57A|nr:hypothetical protein [Kribbella sp. ALI-6-A]ONI68660.1 hypothetical protein BWI15_37425 [Kribbella sp. ALI-6-A]